MGSTIPGSTVYQSLDKFSESLVQCPICLYFIKVNPQTDSMKFRNISDHEIHFLTQHQFNKSVHILILSYINFSYSQIIDFKELSSTSDSSHVFPLFHLVNLSEYTNFRNRILELESNNNELISSFKTKLDTLEQLYNRSNDEILSSQSENISLNVENSILISQKELSDFSFQTLESENFFLKSENDRLISELTSKDSLIDSLQTRNNDLTNQVTELVKKPTTTVPSDGKLRNLLEQEKALKRTAVREYNGLQIKYNLLEEKIHQFETEFSSEKAIFDQEVQTLKTTNEQAEHLLVLSYEKKISDLTLQLQEHEEQIKLLLSQDKPNKVKPSKSDKDFRLHINSEFIALQKKFNEIQYNILLSFYDLQHVDPQLRNAFEKFFDVLIKRANSAGQLLLNDPDFSLFKDLREIATRLKFTPEQQEAALQIQALNIVFSDLCVYIFVIIKAVKAKFEDTNYIIIPEDAQIISLIPAFFTTDRVTFTISQPEIIKLLLENQTRVFRPTSALFKNSFIFLTTEDLSLSNNSYQLLPFELLEQPSSLSLTIDNFFTPEDTFQLLTVDFKHFIIQRGDQREYNFIRECMKNIK